jgi:hypothetical protein
MQQFFLQILTGDSPPTVLDPIQDPLIQAPDRIFGIGVYGHQEKQRKLVPGADLDLLLIHSLKCKDYGSELGPCEHISSFTRESLDGNKLWFVGVGCDGRGTD